MTNKNWKRAETDEEHCVCGDAGEYQILNHLSPIEQVRGEDDLEHLTKDRLKVPLFLDAEWEDQDSVLSTEGGRGTV